MRILTLTWVQSRDAEGQATADLVRALAGQEAEVMLLLPDPDGPCILTGLRVLSTDGPVPLQAGPGGARQEARAGIHPGGWPAAAPLTATGGPPLIAEMTCVA